MAHDHDHGHGHDHHAAASYGTSFAVGIALNGAFVVVESVYGFVSGSVALVADAAHNLTDVLGLALAWAAFVVARRRPTRTRTYGLRKTTILAALANASILFVAIGGVVWEAIGRISHPTKIEGGVVMAVAAAGVVVNGVSALSFAKGRKRDANVKGAFLHLAADAAVSLGVVLAGALILKTRWMPLDPIVSILVSGVILVGTWGLLKQSVNLALDAVPAGIDAEVVRRHLAELDGVLDVHDLHIWAMSTTETALTAHLVMETNAREPCFLRDVERSLHEKFEIDHVTLQIEAADAPDPCRRPCAPEEAA